MVLAMILAVGSLASNTPETTMATFLSAYNVLFTVSSFCQDDDPALAAQAYECLPQSSADSAANFTGAQLCTSSCQETLLASFESDCVYSKIIVAPLESLPKALEDACTIEPPPLPPCAYALGEVAQTVSSVHFDLAECETSSVQELCGCVESVMSTFNGETLGAVTTLVEEACPAAPLEVSAVLATSHASLLTVADAISVVCARTFPSTPPPPPVPPAPPACFDNVTELVTLGQQCVEAVSAPDSLAGATPCTDLLVEWTSSPCTHPEEQFPQLAALYSNITALKAKVNSLELPDFACLDAQLPSHAIACGQALSVWNFSLGDACPAECMVDINVTACTAPDGFSLPHAVDVALHGLMALGSKCETDCLTTALPQLVTSSEQCATFVSGILSGQDYSTPDYLDGFAKCQVLIQDFSQSSCGGPYMEMLKGMVPPPPPPAPEGSDCAAEQAPFQFTTQFMTNLQACAAMVLVYDLGDACPSQCLAALELAKQYPCATQELLVSAGLEDLTVDDLIASVEAADTTLASVCSDTCVETYVPEIVTLVGECLAPVSTQDTMLTGILASCVPEEMTSTIWPECTNQLVVQSWLDAASFSCTLDDVLYSCPAVTLTDLTANAAYPCSDACSELSAKIDVTKCGLSQTQDLQTGYLAAYSGPVCEAYATCLDKIEGLETAFTQCGIERGGSVLDDFVCTPGCVAAVSDVQAMDCQTAVLAAAESANITTLTNSSLEQLAATLDAAAAVVSKCGTVCTPEIEPSELAESIDALMLEVKTCLSEFVTVNGTDICPASCYALYEKVTQHPTCLPDELLATVTPEWFGILSDACDVQATCESEAAAVKPLAEECFTQMVGLPTGLSSCNPTCVEAVQVATSGVCQSYALELASRVRIERYGAAEEPATISLKSAVATALALHRFAAVLDVAEGLCSDDCLDLTSTLQETCNQTLSLAADDCSLECRDSYGAAIRSCLGSPGYGWNLENADASLLCTPAGKAAVVAAAAVTAATVNELTQAASPAPPPASPAPPPPWSHPSPTPLA